MSDLANYAETAMYEWLTGRASPPAAAGRFLHLYTAVTDAEAGTGTELAVAGYVKQAISFGASSNGAGSNDAVLRFGPLSVGATVTHAAIRDAAGNALSTVKALAASKTFGDGDIIEFGIGEIDLAML